MKLDHERLDVYQVSLDFAAWAYALAKQLRTIDRYSRDQLLRASQSIALNIAEGCGKLPSPERRRFLQIAGGSARECAAILDILCRCRVIAESDWQAGKELLVRIVAMLTRMMGSLEHVREPEAVYGYEYEYGEHQTPWRGGTRDRARGVLRTRTQRSGTRTRTRSGS